MFDGGKKGICDVERLLCGQNTMFVLIEAQLTKNTLIEFYLDKRISCVSIACMSLLYVLQR